MARRPRGKYIDPTSTQIVHVVTRCVRGAYLCGRDNISKRSFEHRRSWIQDRLAFLAAEFGIDCLTFSVMSNHVHVILRSRPDVVRSWTDREVAERWVKLCPNRDGALAPPEEVKRLMRLPEQIVEIRRRLSDVSWWMRLLTQSIARRANREDGCTGRFWEGRFKAQILADDAAILACTLYVDLNPIRATLANSLQDASYTGAKVRLDAIRARRNRNRTSSDSSTTWLCPIPIVRRSNTSGSAALGGNAQTRRKGFLQMSEVDYLRLADWTGRQARPDKRGHIPRSIRPVLERLHIASDQWLEINRTFRSLFRKGSGIKISNPSKIAA